ncbi:MAG: PP2C family protein-serine/threonine phosphatase [Desertimonas sp.]
MPFSGRPISARDFHLIEESLRGVEIAEVDVGDAPPLPEDQVPAMVQAVHASRSAILLTDADLDDGPSILYANPACERLTGYTADELLGLTPRVLQGVSTDRGVLDHVRANLERGLGYEGDVVNYRKDGQPYVVALRIIPVHAGGETVAFVAIEDDVTRTWMMRTQWDRNLHALDDALRPPPPDDPAGVEVVTTHVPADQTAIGGDWSDVIESPDGVVHLVVGDASGHGLVSGIYQGRYRWPLFGLLRCGVEPTDALAEVRRMNASIETMASIVVASLDRDRRHVSVITAGHPDVIVAGSGGVARVRSDHPTIGVGLPDVAPVESPVTVELSPGSMICLFSDGLVERRGEPLDVGIDTVVDVLRRTPHGAALGPLAEEIVCETRGATDHRDDVGLLLARV